MLSVRVRLRWFAKMPLIASCHFGFARSVYKYHFVSFPISVLLTFLSVKFCKYFNSFCSVKP